MFFDPNYFIYMIPAFILMAITTWYVRSSYQKWSQVPAQSRLTGAQAAQRLISSGGLYGIQIQTIAGDLTDNYDPRSKVLNLSQDVSNTASVAALAIAAHELGHAIQDAEGYFPLRFRSALVPAVNIGSSLGWILIFLGLFIFKPLAWIGVIVFALGAVFALATLPVEFDASNRAKRLLTDSGLIIGEEERGGVNTVLNAAALTYVAGLVTALLQVLYYANLVRGRRN